MAILKLTGQTFLMQELEHRHNYLIDDKSIARNEKRTLYVVILTVVMMVVEIFFGHFTGSMALLADGWHMGSHAGALSISLLAYRLAKSQIISRKFCFGAGKIIPLGGYTSALILAVMAVIMTVESIEHLLNPITIRFDEAIAVAVIGLIVNIVSAFILRDSHQHEDGHGDHDHNIRGAYMHVLADTLTSVFAIVALTGGKFFGIIWMDSVMGILGAAVILKWAWGLCRDTAIELLDPHDTSISFDKVRTVIENETTKIVDFHAWRIAPKVVATEIVIEVQYLKGARFYREIIEENFCIGHLTIEERLKIVK